MKKLLFLFIAIASTSHAQIKPIGVQFFVGNIVNSFSPNGLNEFKLMAEDQSIFALNDSFKISNSKFENINASGIYGGHVLLSLPNKKAGGYHRNRMMRLGFTAGTSSGNVVMLSRLNELQLDSIQGSAVFERTDSVAMFSYHSSVFGLQTAYLISGNTLRRFSLYGGLGVGFSSNFNAKIDKEEYSITSKYFVFDGKKYTYDKKEYTFGDDGNRNNVEPVKASTAITYQVVVPLGVQWRITKKDNWLKGVYVSLEMQGNLNYTKIKSGNSTFSLNSQSQLGLSWRNL